jgi:hypothetical protein
MRLFAIFVIIVSVLWAMAEARASRYPSPSRYKSHKSNYDDHRRNEETLK